MEKVAPIFIEHSPGSWMRHRTEVNSWFGRGFKASDRGQQCSCGASPEESGLTHFTEDISGILGHLIDDSGEIVRSLTEDSSVVVKHLTDNISGILKHLTEGSSGVVWHPAENSSMFKAHVTEETVGCWDI